MEFVDGIQTVPITWLTDDKTQCYYPAHVHKLHVYNKMVEDITPVNFEWPIWNVIQIIGSSSKYSMFITG